MNAQPRNALEDLLQRMRHRSYPETIPVLTSYWLRTVCAAGHNRFWWHEMHTLVGDASRDKHLDDPARESLTDLCNWLQRTELPIRHEPDDSSVTESFREDVAHDWLAPYIARLLNEWLPAEASSLLIDAAPVQAAPVQAAPVQGDDTGIPVLTLGKALERLLVRERLSPAALETLLPTEQLSPRYVYPAELEMLHDVVLALLGRTWGPPLPVLPATVLDIAEDSSLPRDFIEKVRQTRLEQHHSGEALHVPITREEALDILHRGPMRIGSVLVTMDGRWWEAEKLLSGDCHAIVYQPRGRLRIDYSAEHAKIIAPFPEAKLRWSGNVHWEAPFELFGREWRSQRYETDAERTWLQLVFSRVLPVPPVQQLGQMRLRRSHPAAVDMAWASLGEALAAALDQQSGEPIEQMRRSDFIPLGRALLRFAESTAKHWLPKPETIASNLQAIRFNQSELAEDYGRIPWRILPDAVRANALRRRLDPASVEIFHQIFEGLPESLLAA